MRGGVEMEDTGLNYLVMYDSGEYGILTERFIHLDPLDFEKAKVYHKNKPYSVEIIRKGTYERIQEKAELFRNKLSINTSEEEASSKVLKNRQAEKKKTRLYSLESESEKEEDVDDFMGDGHMPKIKKQKTNATDSVKATNPPRSSKSPQKTPQRSPPRTPPTLLPRSPPKNTASNSTVAEAIAEMQRQIATLTEANLRSANTSRFVVTGVNGDTKNIVEEIFGKNFVKWSLAVTCFLFTEDEIMESTLVPSDRTSRSFLNAEKVNLLRQAFVSKYKFDQVALDRAWSAVIKAVNNKGRNLKLRRRTRNLLNQVTTTITRTFSSQSIRTLP
jgi:hypothetical protein